MLCTLDTEQFKNFVQVFVFEGGDWPFDETRGPCILTQPKHWTKHLLDSYSDPYYQFTNRSIVSICYDQKLCNGFGAWTVPKAMHLWFKMCKWNPFSKAFYLFRPSDNSVFENFRLKALHAFLCLPQYILEEYKLYIPNQYTPSAPTKQMIRFKKDFFVELVQVHIVN